MARRWAVRLLSTIALACYASPAFAEEPVSSLAPATSPRERIRRLLLMGHGDEAREAIGDQLASEISMHERAALLELHAMGTTWRWARPPPPMPDTAGTNDTADTNASHSGKASAPSATEWDTSFELARNDLARGAFAAAARRLRVLVDTAPDLFDASRSTELRSLAFDALRDRSASSDRPPTTATPARFDIPPRTQTTRWYGWQTLIADGVAIVITPVAPAAGAALYLTGGPTVHVMNWNITRAGASLGIRAGLPLGAGLVGALGGAVLGAANGSHESSVALSSAAFGVVGAGVGAICAVVVDSAVIAKERVPAEPTKAALTTFRPSAAPRKDGGLDIGIAGTW